MIFETLMPIDECVQRLQAANQQPVSGVPRPLSRTFYDSFGHPNWRTDTDGRTLEVYNAYRSQWKWIPIFRGTIASDQNKGSTRIEGRYVPYLFEIILFVFMGLFFVVFPFIGESYGTIPQGEPRSYLIDQLLPLILFPTFGILILLAVLFLNPLWRRRRIQAYFRELLHATLLST